MSVLPPWEKTTTTSLSLSLKIADLKPQMQTHTGRIREIEREKELPSRTGVESPVLSHFPQGSPREAAQANCPFSPRFPNPEMNSMRAALTPEAPTFEGVSVYAQRLTTAWPCRNDFLNPNEDRRAQLLPPAAGEPISAQHLLLSSSPHEPAIIQWNPRVTHILLIDSMLRDKWNRWLSPLLNWAGKMACGQWAPFACRGPQTF